MKKLVVLRILPAPESDGVERCSVEAACALVTAGVISRHEPAQ